jgi:uncharacterized protein (TIGR02300 family)
MSKTEWGVKRRCAKCEAPFYDMLRFPILCPKCGSAFRPDAPVARRSAAAKSPVKIRAARIPPKSTLPTLDSAPEEIQPSKHEARDAEDEEEIDRDEEEQDEFEADDEGVDGLDEAATPDEPQPGPRAR